MSHSETSRAHLHHTEDGHTVTNLELFFDLVFVFALTQVTALLADDLTGTGVVRGILVLAVMWWSWVGYSWLTNFVRADDGPVRLVLIGVMGLMLLMALAIPEAFGDTGGDAISAPLLFGLCYLAIRVLHIVLFALAGRSDVHLVRTLTRFSLSTALGTIPIIAAAFTDGTTQILLWAAALLIDVGGVLLIDAAGWRLNAPGHFAERHGLIVIIALGESIVAIGAGAAGRPINGPVILAAALSLVIVTGLWWTYFDIMAVVAEGLLAGRTGADRAAMARDSYTILHFPMVTGVVFVALGLKKALINASEAGSLTGVAALKTVPSWALFGGAATYLIAHIAFRWRNTHTVGWQRPAAAAGLLMCALLATGRPALIPMALTAAVLVGLICYESLRYREFRQQLRHAEPQHG